MADDALGPTWELAADGTLVAAPMDDETPVRVLAFAGTGAGDLVKTKGCVPKVGLFADAPGRDAPAPASPRCRRQARKAAQRVLEREKARLKREAMRRYGARLLKQGAGRVLKLGARAARLGGVAGLVGLSGSSDPKAGWQPVGTYDLHGTRVKFHIPSYAPQTLILDTCFGLWCEQELRLVGDIVDYRGGQIAVDERTRTVFATKGADGKWTPVAIGHDEPGKPFFGAFAVQRDRGESLLSQLPAPDSPVGFAWNPEKDALRVMADGSVLGSFVPRVDPETGRIAPLDGPRQIDPDVSEADRDKLFSLVLPVDGVGSVTLPVLWENGKLTIFTHPLLGYSGPGVREAQLLQNVLVGAELPDGNGPVTKVELRSGKEVLALPPERDLSRANVPSEWNEAVSIAGPDAFHWQRQTLVFKGQEHVVFHNPVTGQTTTNLLVDGEPFDNLSRKGAMPVEWEQPVVVTAEGVRQTNRSYEQVWWLVPKEGWKLVPDGTWWNPVWKHEDGTYTETHPGLEWTNASGERIPPEAGDPNLNPEAARVWARPSGSGKGNIPANATVASAGSAVPGNSGVPAPVEAATDADDEAVVVDVTIDPDLVDPHPNPRDRVSAVAAAIWIAIGAAVPWEMPEPTIDPRPSEIVGPTPADNGIASVDWSEEAPDSAGKVMQRAEVLAQTGRDLSPEAIANGRAVCLAGAQCVEVSDVWLAAGYAPQRIDIIERDEEIAARVRDNASPLGVPEDNIHVTPFESFAGGSGPFHYSSVSMDFHGPVNPKSIAALNELLRKNAEPQVLIHVAHPAYRERGDGKVIQSAAIEKVTRESDVVVPDGVSIDSSVEAKAFALSHLVVTGLGRQADHLPTFAYFENTLSERERAAVQADFRARGWALDPDHVVEWIQAHPDKAAAMKQVVRDSFTRVIDRRLGGRFPAAAGDIADVLLLSVSANSASPYMPTNITTYVYSGRNSTPMVGSIVTAERDPELAAAQVELAQAFGYPNRFEFTPESYHAFLAVVELDASREPATNRYVDLRQAEPVPQTGVAVRAAPKVDERGVLRPGKGEGWDPAVWRKTWLPASDFTRPVFLGSDRQFVLYPPSADASGPRLVDARTGAPVTLTDAQRAFLIRAQKGEVVHNGRMPPRLPKGVLRVLSSPKRSVLWVQAPWDYAVGDPEDGYEIGRDGSIRPTRGVDVENTLALAPSVYFAEGSPLLNPQGIHFRDLPVQDIAAFGALMQRLKTAERPPLVILENGVLRIDRLRRVESPDDNVAAAGYAPEQLVLAESAVPGTEFGATLGDRLAKQRELVGVTRRAIRAATGIVQDTLTDVEQGNRPVRRDVLERLSMLYNIHPAVAASGNQVMRFGIPGHPGAVARQLREDRNISAEKVAQAMGAAGPALQAVERGTKPMSLDLANKLANVLGLPGAGPSIAFADYDRAVSARDLDPWTFAVGERGTVRFQHPDGSEVDMLVVDGIPVTGATTADGQLAWRVGGGWGYWPTVVEDNTMGSSGQLTSARTLMGILKPASQNADAVPLPQSRLGQSTATVTVALRNAADLSLEEVATSTGLDVSVVEEIERTGQVSDAHTVEALARFYGVDPISILFPGESRIDLGPGHSGMAAQRLRRQREMTEATFGWAVGIDPAVVSDTEAGGLTDPEMAQRWAAALGKAHAAGSLLHADFLRRVDRDVLRQGKVEADGNGKIWFRHPEGWRVQMLVVDGVTVSGTLLSDDRVVWRVRGPNESLPQSVEDDGFRKEGDGSGFANLLAALKHRGARLGTVEGPGTGHPVDSVELNRWVSVTEDGADIMFRRDDGSEANALRIGEVLVSGRVLGAGAAEWEIRNVEEGRSSYFTDGNFQSGWAIPEVRVLMQALRPHLHDGGRLSDLGAPRIGPAGDVLRSIRRRAGVTRKELAKAVGVSDRSVAAWEDNSQGMKAASVINVALYFNVHPGDLAYSNEAPIEVGTQAASGDMLATLMGVEQLSFAQVAERSNRKGAGQIHALSKGGVNKLEVGRDLSTGLSFPARGILFNGFERRISRSDLAEWKTYVGAEGKIRWRHNSGNWDTAAIVIDGVRVTGTLGADGRVVWRAGPRTPRQATEEENYYDGLTAGAHPGLARLLDRR